MTKKNVFIIFCLIFFSIANSTLISKKIPYVILVSLDGFRYDYLQEDSIPNFQKIIDEGVYASSLKPVFPSTTFPNHYSIITGLYPENHGIISNYFLDPFTGEMFDIKEESEPESAKWYLGEPFWQTAKRNGIKSAVFFWIGSEHSQQYKRPDYNIQYDASTPELSRINQALDWLQIDENNRPHFISIYFERTDITGHKFGTSSIEMKDCIHLMDSLLGKLLSGLKKINMIDSVNLIVLSDHGMMDLVSSEKINIEQILGNFDYKIQNYGAYMMIDALEENILDIYLKLKTNEKNYTVFTKDNIPESYHFSKHPFISPIIIIAEPGYILIDENSKDNAEYIKAVHGYDNNYLNMHGIFLAMGPAFKKAYSTGTLNNIDIYSLLCEIYNIRPKHNIDGSLSRIEFILKGR